MEALPMIGAEGGVICTANHGRALAASVPQG